MKPVLDGVRQNLGADPKRVLAEAGYQSKSNLEMLEQTSIEGYIATDRQKDLDQARFPSCDTAVAGSRKS